MVDKNILLKNILFLRKFNKNLNGIKNKNFLIIALIINLLPILKSPMKHIFSIFPLNHNIEFKNFILL